MRKIQMLASMEGTIQGHPCDHRSSQQVILTLLVSPLLAAVHYLKHHVTAFRNTLLTIYFEMISDLQEHSKGVRAPVPARPLGLPRPVTGPPLALGS